MTKSMKSYARRALLTSLSIVGLLVGGAQPVVKSKAHSQPVVANASKAISPQQTITRFLQWYQANHKKANSFPLLDNTSTGDFIVNKAACDNYLNFIRSSGYISQEYIAHWSRYFSDQGKELLEHPASSDVPEGFDFDFVLITQEPELVLNKIDQIKFTTLSANKTTAIIGVKWPGDESMEYEFEMNKINHRWQITYIATPNFD